MKTYERQIPVHGEGCTVVAARSGTKWTAFGTWRGQRIKGQSERSRRDAFHTWELEAKKTAE